jgi:GMP synthase (glutamine-hydrolysing)
MPSADRCLILQHAATEGPQRLAEVLAEAGVGVEVCALHRGEPVPRSLPVEVPLVVLGGAMGVSDIGDPVYPFLPDEVALLRSHLGAGGPVLGICLGAQLLAHAAGARVQPNVRPTPEGTPARVYEVGWAPVDFLGVDVEPALAGLAPREVMLHWHGDTFDLPRGAVHLASTPACANQAFRLGGRAFGVQFHPEVDPATLEQWLLGDADYVARANGPEGAARIRAETSLHFASFAQARDRLLRNLVRCLLAR